MKTFVRGILTTVLVFTFVLIPTVIFVESAVSDDLIGVYVKELFVQEIAAGIEDGFSDLSSEDVDQLKEDIRNNSEIQEIITKYSDRIITDLSAENIEDINLEDDLKTIIKENRSFFEEAIGRELTDEKIDQVIDDVTQDQDFNETYREMMTDAQDEMPADSKAIIDGYNSLTSSQFIIGLGIVTVVAIVLIALLKKPYYKWIVNVAIAGVIAAIFVAIIGISITFVLNLVMESLDEAFVISSTPILLTAGAMFLVSIILFVINSFLDKNKAKENAVS